MKAKANKVIPYLDVLMDNHNSILNTTIYHKSTYSGLLTVNFNSFNSRFYRISFIKCLINCASVTSNTWASFG